jgi:hypothetical protein
MSAQRLRANPWVMPTVLCLGKTPELGVCAFVRFPGDVSQGHVSLGGDARARVVLKRPVIDYPKECHEEDLRQNPAERP